MPLWNSCSSDFEGRLYVAFLAAHFLSVFTPAWKFLWNGLMGHRKWCGVVEYLCRIIRRKSIISDELFLVDVIDQVWWRRGVRGCWGFGWEPKLTWGLRYCLAGSKNFKKLQPICNGLYKTKSKIFSYIFRFMLWLQLHQRRNYSGGVNKFNFCIYKQIVHSRGVDS